MLYVAVTRHHLHPAPTALLCTMLFSSSALHPAPIAFLCTDADYVSQYWSEAHNFAFACEPDAAAPAADHTDHASEAPSSEASAAADDAAESSTSSP